MDMNLSQNPLQNSQNQDISVSVVQKNNLELDQNNDDTFNNLHTPKKQRDQSQSLIDDSINNTNRNLITRKYSNSNSNRNQNSNNFRNSNHLRNQTTFHENNLSQFQDKSPSNKFKSNGNLLLVTKQQQFQNQNYLNNSNGKQQQKKIRGIDGIVDLAVETPSKRFASKKFEKTGKFTIQANSTLNETMQINEVTQKKLKVIFQRAKVLEKENKIRQRIMKQVNDTESRRFQRLNDTILNILNDRCIITDFFPFYRPEQNEKTLRQETKQKIKQNKKYLKIQRKRKSFKEILKQKVETWEHRIGKLFPFKAFNPMNIFIFQLQVLECLCVVMDIFFYSLFCFFNYYERDFFLYLNIISLGIEFLSMFFRMNTAYFDQGQVVTDRTQIIHKFRIELLIYHLTGIFSTCFQMSVQDNSIQTKIVCIFMLTKYKLFLTNIEEIENRLNLSGSMTHMWSLFKLMGQALTLCHIVATAYYFLAYIEKEFQLSENNWVDALGFQHKTIREQYVQSFYWAATTMTLIGTQGENEIETVFCLIILVCTVGVFATILSQVSMVWEEMAQKQKDYKRDRDILNQFFNLHHLSTDLQGQLHNYLKYLFQGHKEKTSNVQFENLLENKFPLAIQDIVRIERYSIQVQKFKLLQQNFSEKAVKELIHIVQEEYYMPNQIIFQRDIYSEPKLYLILSGEAELYQETGEIDSILQTLSNGNYFGQDTFFTDTIPFFSARSTHNSFTTLLAISRNKFIQIIQDFGTQEDREKFSVMKDQMTFQGISKILNYKCYICNQTDHNEQQCSLINYAPNRLNIIAKLNFSVHQNRQTPFLRSRNIERFKTIDHMDILYDRFQILITNPDLRKFLKNLQEHQKKLQQEIDNLDKQEQTLSDEEDYYDYELDNQLNSVDEDSSDDESNSLKSSFSSEHSQKTKKSKKKFDFKKKMTMRFNKQKTNKNSEKKVFNSKGLQSLKLNEELDEIDECFQNNSGRHNIEKFQETYIQNTQFFASKSPKSNLNPINLSYLVNDSTQQETSNFLPLQQIDLFNSSASQFSNKESKYTNYAQKQQILRRQSNSSPNMIGILRKRNSSQTYKPVHQITTDLHLIDYKKNNPKQIITRLSQIQQQNSKELVNESIKIKDYVREKKTQFSLTPQVNPNKTQNQHQRNSQNQKQLIQNNLSQQKHLQTHKYQPQRRASFQPQNFSQMQHNHSSISHGLSTLKEQVHITPHNKSKFNVKQSIRNLRASNQVMADPLFFILNEILEKVEQNEKTLLDNKQQQQEILQEGEFQQQDKNEFSILLDKMHCFRYYFPHNNYVNTIAEHRKYLKFADLSKKRQQVKKRIMLKQIPKSIILQNQSHRNSEVMSPIPLQDNQSTQQKTQSINRSQFQPK